MTRTLHLDESEIEIIRTALDEHIKHRNANGLSTDEASRVMAKLSGGDERPGREQPG